MTLPWARLLPVLIVLLHAAAGAQAGLKRCLKCKDQRLLACPAHGGLDLDGEDDVLFCSFVAGCEACGGTGRIDCDGCSAPEAEAGLAKRRLANAGAAPGLAKLDEVMGRTLRKAESAHVVLVLELDELKVDKQRLDGHALLHLYLARLEALHTAYTGALGVEDQEFPKKPHVFVWSMVEDHLEGSLRFCGTSAENGVKLLGHDPAYSVAGIKRLFKDDETLHRNLVHNTAHLLMSNQRPSDWVGQRKGGWADEGIAHWFEDRFFGRCDNYCYQEVDTSHGGFKGGVWRPAVRKLVAGGDLPPAAAVMVKNTTVLEPAEHALSFSYVDFLMAKDAAKLNQLLCRLRAKVETREAMQEIFGWNLIEFDDAWRAWVLATYPAR